MVPRVEPEKVRSSPPAVSEMAYVVDDHVSSADVRTVM